MKKWVTMKSPFLIGRLRSYFCKAIYDKEDANDVTIPYR